MFRIRKYLKLLYVIKEVCKILLVLVLLRRDFYFGFKFLEVEVMKCIICIIFMSDYVFVNCLRD